jgi:hypothetical protein
MLPELTMPRPPEVRLRLEDDDRGTGIGGGDCGGEARRTAPTNDDIGACVFRDLGTGDARPDSAATDPCGGDFGGAVQL